ncbi:hypothetical protein GCM10027610_071060 [Dactylosporangium cerinum]
MVEDPSELRNIIDETDWLALKGSSKSLFDLDTPDMLRGLVSSDVREVEMGLSHLVFGLGDGVNVMPATVPAVRYVLALLPRIPGETAMRPRVSGIRKPLRAHLLEWLGDTADAVSDDSERRFVDLAGFSPLKYPASPWHKVRQLRPQIFEVVSAFLEDQDPVTRRKPSPPPSFSCEAPNLRRTAMLSPCPPKRFWTHHRIPPRGTGQRAPLRNCGGLGLRRQNSEPRPTRSCWSDGLPPIGTDRC